MGKLIHMLSHEMKRNQPIDKVIKADLTIMQKHILKFILLETMHKDLYQKDIEEEFQIRKSTVTGYVQLMEKNGYLTRESVKGDARKKRLVPTEKAEGLRQAILEDIKLSEKRMEKGIPDSGIGISNLSIISRNRSRSSARSMTDGDVPRIFTPFFSSSAAIFSGVCPPN